MDEKLANTITTWLNDKVFDSTKFKNIKTAMEADEQIIYASVEFILKHNDDSKRIIREESRISLSGISETELKKKLDDIVNRISI